MSGMFQTKMAAFSKSLECPTSEQLLAFHLGQCGDDRHSEINAHVSSCDFCGAELDLYRHFPSAQDEAVQREDIPVHLYELAEALLKNRTSGADVLIELIGGFPGNDRDLS